MKIQTINPSKKLLLGTTTGLKKRINEDQIDFKPTTNGFRVCISDGHWGKKTAEMINTFFIKKMKNFPNDFESGLCAVKKLETDIFKKFGRKNMNPNKDFTPEASFLSFEILNKPNHTVISLLGYGDCGLIISENGKLIFDLPMNESWIGCFSHLGLRGRKDLSECLIFKKIQLKKNQKILAFTDGIDHCIYEKLTINHEKLARMINHSIKKAFTIIFKKVENMGAEDNASLALYKV
ncbi:MAG: hypothetical protein RBS56_02370 [Candidatus Gracilibacteria bacterium]|jgi:hypothetical protein|nr:hypothetical protein [Candidatus Gracilibacteria bacterium]